MRAWGEQKRFEINMTHKHWPKIIAHVDMDAFFAQIEQRDFPELRGKPVCITNGEQGSCIITRSYEARRYGIRTGMRLHAALKRCPGLIRRPSRPAVYAYVSSQIMSALEDITPDMEIFSVDEAFLDLSHCRQLYHHARHVGRLIKERIWDASRLTCSVGVSGDKTTAKYASKKNKPDGLLIIPPWRARAALANAHVTDLCGINKGIAQFLSQYQVYRCADMARIPMPVLSKRFGNLGKRIWKMCLGEDPESVHTVVMPPQSMGHGKVLPPNTKDELVILGYLCHMAEKVGFRLRKHAMCAQHFYVGLKTQEGWLADRVKTIQATNDGLQIYQLAKCFVQRRWQGEGVFQCQITAQDPQVGGGQLDLFQKESDQRHAINMIMDKIQLKFGKASITTASRLLRLPMPDVISPAWRPNGHRESIQV